MNERLRQLRRSLNLTQQEFADKIGSKRNTIAKYETNANTPSAAVISLICREFNVNEEWLRTGKGEMKEQLTDQQKVMKYAALLLKDKNSVMAAAIKAFIVTYEQLDEQSKAVMENLIINTMENFKKSQ